MRLWDAVNGQQRWSLPLGTDNVMALAFRRDGQVLAGGAFGGVKLWSAEPRPQRWPPRRWWHG